MIFIDGTIYEYHYCVMNIIYWVWEVNTPECLLHALCQPSAALKACSHSTCNAHSMRIQSGFERSHSDAHWRRCAFQFASVKPPEEVVSMRIRLADPVLRVDHVIELRKVR